MKPLVSTLALLACITTANAATNRPFTYDVKIEHYTIHGASGVALAAQMNKRGPKVHKTANYRSWAASFIGITAGTFEPCYLHIHADIIMPRWVDYPKASAYSKKKWDIFYNKVLEHEYKHFQFIKDLEPFIHEHHCTNDSINYAWKEIAPLRDKELDDKAEKDGAPDLYAVGTDYVPFQLVQPASENKSDSLLTD